jgi:uncharacterized small protein (DUF1192 family)
MSRSVAPQGKVVDGWGKREADLRAEIESIEAEIRAKQNEASRP